MGSSEVNLDFVRGRIKVSLIIRLLAAFGTLSNCLAAPDYIPKSGGIDFSKRPPAKYSAALSDFYDDGGSVIYPIPLRMPITRMDEPVKGQGPRPNAYFFDLVGSDFVLPDKKTYGDSLESEPSSL